MPDISYVTCHLCSLSLFPSHDDIGGDLTYGENFNTNITHTPMLYMYVCMYVCMYVDMQICQVDKADMLYKKSGSIAAPQFQSHFLGPKSPPNCIALHHNSTLITRIYKYFCMYLIVCVCVCLSLSTFHRLCGNQPLFFFWYSFFSFFLHVYV